MAFESDPISLQPAAISLGAPITADDLAQIPGMANWVHHTRASTHFNLSAGPVTALGGDAVGSLWISFRPVADGDVVVLRNRIKVQPEVANVVVGARCVMAAANTGTVRFDVGAANATLTFANSDNGAEKKTTIATATPGWLTVTVTIEKTAGAGAAYIYNLRCCDEQRSNYPAPQNE